jgi:Ca2+-binding EF-hand superfamily protein
LQAARGGDRDALNGITSYASALLDASKAFNASTPAYQADLQRVTDALAALPKQVSAEQFIVDAIDDSKEAVVDATRVMQETLRTAVAANSPAAVATALNANFDKLDTSVNGLLDFNEFLAGLGPLATKAEQEAAKVIFNAIDTNGDGQISRLELANAALGSALAGLDANNTHTVNAAAQAAAHADILRAAINANNPSLVAAALDASFSRLDTSVNGLLDYSEFVAGLGPMATRAEQEAARQIFNQIDANGDGQIDKLELVRARTAGVEQQTGAAIPIQQDSAGTLRAINEVSSLQRSQLEALNNQFAYSPFTAPNGVRLDSNLVTALNKIVFNTANTVIGQRAGASYTFARGGYVAGPGTGTSDSIDARLSNGEFVVTAEATRRYGRSMLDAMNDNRLQAPVMPFPVAVGGGEGNAALLAEVRALRADLAALRGDVRENTEVAEQGHLETIKAAKGTTAAVQEGNATASRQSLARKPKAA